METAFMNRWLGFSAYNGCRKDSEVDEKCKLYLGTNHTL